MDKEWKNRHTKNRQTLSIFNSTSSFTFPHSFFDRLKHMIVDIFMNIKLYQWKSKIMKYLRDIIDTIYNTAI